MSEQYMQVPVGLVRSAAALLELAGRQNTSADLLALLSQPTAEPDPYEYETTNGQRKAWADADAPPEGGGWELDPDRGRPGESWERFDFHEERYWRRLRQPAAPPSIADLVPGTTFTASWRGTNIHARFMKVGSTDYTLNLVGQMQTAVRPVRIDPSTIHDVTPPKDAS